MSLLRLATITFFTRGQAAQARYVHQTSERLISPTTMTHVPSTSVETDERGHEYSRYGPAWPMQVVRVSMRAVQPRSCRHSASGPVAACAAKPLETASKGPATFARASRGPGKTKPVWDTDRERDSSPRTSAWARACTDDLSWGAPSRRAASSSTVPGAPRR